jgi:hypothetical protein
LFSGTDDWQMNWQMTMKQEIKRKNKVLQTKRRKSVVYLKSTIEPMTMRGSRTISYAVAT